MATENLPVNIHDIAVHCPGATLFLKETHVIAVRNEADILALRFFSNLQTKPRSVAAHLLLGHSAERETDVLHLLTGQCEKEIGLVLIAITPFPESHATIFLNQLSIMPGDQVVCLQLASPVQKDLEFEHLVAKDTGVGRATIEVVVTKTINHCRFELFFKIDNVERYFK